MQRSRVKAKSLAIENVIFVRFREPTVPSWMESEDWNRLAQEGKERIRDLHHQIDICKALARKARDLARPCCVGQNRQSESGQKSDTAGRSSVSRIKP